jgi:hypothetical protein
MKKPNTMAVSTIVILAGSLLILPSIPQFASAQYGAPPPEMQGGSAAPPEGETTGAPTAPAGVEEQLELAKESVSNAKQTGAYGSGTAMLGSNISETVIFIGILAAIFGGVAGAFFYRSRVAAKKAAA